MHRNLPTAAAARRLMLHCSVARSPNLLRRRPDLAELAGAQCGAVSRRQLRALGLTSDVVRHQVGAVRWQTAGPNVVVTFTGPLPAATRRWCALLNAGRCAALASWTALEVRGLTGWEREPVHLVLDRGSRPPPMPAVVLHESRRHLGSDVSARQGMPAQSVERAAVDAAAWSRSPRTATGVLAAVVQQGLSSAERLTAVLQDQGRIRHRRVLIAALADIAGGAQALSEIDFVRLCVEAGLPRPILQAVRTDALGRRRYLDAEWRSANGEVRAVEVDGMGHLDPARWYDDLLREADVTATGTTRLIRVPAAAVRRDGPRVVDILRRHLAPSGPVVDPAVGVRTSAGHTASGF